MCHARYVADQFHSSLRDAPIILANVRGIETVRAKVMRGYSTGRDKEVSKSEYENKLQISLDCPPDLH